MADTSDTIARSIDVDVPLDAAYEAWADIESFPLFMEGVHEVRRRADGTLAWRADVDGQEETWDVEIVEAVEDELISWRSVSGPTLAGTVTFVPLNDTTTTVTLHVRHEPQGLIAGALGTPGRRVEGDLERFKRHAERLYGGTGWHDPAGGPVSDGDVSASRGAPGAGRSDRRRR
jgi:uncharacterized membrane protein